LGTLFSGHLYSSITFWQGTHLTSYATSMKMHAVIWYTRTKRYQVSEVSEYSA